MTLLYLYLIVTSMQEPKYCIHCKHFKPSFFGREFGKCAMLPIIKKDENFLVTGVKTQKKDYRYCSTAREYECGEEGKLYEEK